MMSSPRPIVVMGVSGTGKSTIGRALAETLDREFVEGDELHPHANRVKMAAGIPLDDSDRAPWLDRVAAELDTPVIVACSALKRSYRDRLRRVAPDLVLVFLHGEATLLAARMEGRDGHFMPSSLLKSQLDTLEEPAADEDTIGVNVKLRPDEIVDLIVSRLQKEQ
jgi:gluconokinase